LRISDRHEIRAGLVRLGASHVNPLLLMQELDPLCIDSQLGWKRFVRHFNWHHRASAVGKEDVSLYEHTKLHGMHEVNQKVDAWKKAGNKPPAPTDPSRRTSRDASPSVNCRQKFLKDPLIPGY
jgi:hypothetical protein